MRDIKYIVIHCTASRQSLSKDELLQEFKDKGWKTPGYHVFIDGTAIPHKILDISYVANGVKGYNQASVHISWAGGIDNKGNAIDNRTEKQKAALLKAVKEMRALLPKAQILGHRDFSPDLNKNGKIDKFERIKECPCFEVKEEYKFL